MDDAAAGEASFWLLLSRRNGEWQPALSVEEDAFTRRVVAAAGRFNRDPTDEESHAIVDWARENGLTSET